MYHISLSSRIIFHVVPLTNYIRISFPSVDVQSAKFKLCPLHTALTQNGRCTLLVIARLFASLHFSRSTTIHLVFNHFAILFFSRVELWKSSLNISLLTASIFEKRIKHSWEFSYGIIQFNLQSRSIFKKYCMIFINLRAIIKTCWDPCCH